MREIEVDAIYWVVSRDCNQRCPHCYNNSEPGAPGLSESEVDICVERLPPPNDVAIQRIILSGGEVLVWPDLLFHVLRRLYQRYGDATSLWVQTNGDLLNEATLHQLLDHHVSRIDIASMDHFHKNSTVQRRGYLSLFSVLASILSWHARSWCASRRQLCARLKNVR